MEERHGKVIKIDYERKFGFVSSGANGVNYYFKISSCHCRLNLNDNVVFLIKEVQDKAEAISIRKVYENKAGIQFIPRLNTSHIHLDLDTILPDIINSISDLKQELIVKEFEFPEIVGETECITTEQDDYIIYAIRKGHFGHTRFVLNRNAVETKYVTIVLLKAETHYLIITIYFGINAPPEPWDEKATLEDLKFWECHALIYKPIDITTGSETEICPWVLNSPAICKVKFVSQNLNSND